MSVFASVVCCQVEVSVLGRSLIQRDPTKCLCCVLSGGGMCWADPSSRGIQPSVCVLCVVRWRYLCWADPSSRGVLPSVCVCCVLSGGGIYVGPIPHPEDPTECVFACIVLLGGGICVGPIPHPEGSYRV